MADCCATNEMLSNKEFSGLCPSCERKGKKVKIITLKSMLKPIVLDTLNANANHFFCPTSDCDVIYFDEETKTYLLHEVKVSVYQKDKSFEVPICYCFNWTRDKINRYSEEKNASKVVEHIRENIKENRCGCEINNPQGSCCLGNVTSYIKGLS